jgi:hypothetical protein
MFGILAQTETPDDEKMEPVTPHEQPVENPQSTGLYIFLGIAVLGIGIAAYYFKIIKPKKDTVDDTDDYDDGYDYDDDQEDSDDDLDDDFEKGDIE